MTDHPPSKRFDLLSRSASGLNYVRDRKAHVMRVLTESELEDFNDPPPCPDCAEQFGCEHLNCAGEALYAEDDIERNVPSEWVWFAREYGLSAKDLERLQAIEQEEGEYRVAPGQPHDMRTLEIVLLLNEAR